MSPDAANDIFAEAQPGDGTRYPILLTPVRDPEFAKRIGCETGYYICTLFHRKITSIVFDPRQHLSHIYIMEKLEISRSSAITVGEILNILIDVQCDTWDEIEKDQKEYEKRNSENV